jgi:hypothetical protein
MEKIDLNNYEAYFLDYMEGNLSAEEKFDLFAFLELHPELKEEFEDDFADMALIPETVTFDAKASLKVEEDSLMVTSATVDELMIASVEGQLSKNQEAKLQAYITENGLAKQYAYYQATQLKPDTSIQFEDKASLKQKTGVVISMTWVTRVAGIAAAGAILVMVALNWGGDASTSVNQPAFFANDFKTHQRLNLDAHQITTDEWVETNNDLVAENEQKSEQNSEEQPLPNDFQPEIENFVEQNPNEDDQDDNSPIILPDDEDPKVEIADQQQESEEGIDEEKASSIEDEYASTNIQEEPYKLVTNAASNLINRDVSYTREKDQSTDDYVAYSFKLGKFEFERKKAK